MIQRFALLAVWLAVPALVSAQALDGTLKRIRDAKAVRIAYRTDALPFSYAKDQEPAGYTVDLCKRVVASIEQQLKVQPIAVKWVAATTQNRLDLVRTGQADMECGATTATLSRMEQVDFSSPVFVDSTGLLARKASGAKSLGDLGGKKIAVVAGTTNQKALETALKGGLVSATVVTVKTRDEGVAALEGGTADALAGDKILLMGLAGKVKDTSAYELLGDDLGLEPYAIALPRGDSAFRLAVNRALARIYSGDAIVEVFRRAFGPNAKPSPALLVMYGLNAYPE
ncbi:MAG TPA: amino acid ABC transporter substrate-binding protein [Anaeromyxobacteraceae bacterium]|nr:amino acid ABC transporter substrate-binding protein [Anaeromyxobacteraceae bacterium]